jgi:hypothetical protein
MASLVFSVPWEWDHMGIQEQHDKRLKLLFVFYFKQGINLQLDDWVLYIRRALSSIIGGRPPAKWEGPAQQAVRMDTDCISKPDFLK